MNHKIINEKFIFFLKKHKNIFIEFLTSKYYFRFENNFSHEFVYPRPDHLPAYTKNRPLKSGYVLFKTAARFFVAALDLVAAPGIILFAQFFKIILCYKQKNKIKDIYSYFHRKIQTK